MSNLFALRIASLAGVLSLSLLAPEAPAMSCSRLPLPATVTPGTAETPAPTARPRNLILFIGDGMGFGQVAVGALCQPGAQAPAPTTTAAWPTFPALLGFEKFPVAGCLSTYSASSFVTDSAAAATALACGEKTKNGMLGVTPDGRAIESVAELAKRSGKAVGIVSSVGFDHATPAGFYAHEPGRGNYETIVDQALASRAFDLLLGGGVCAKSLSPEALRAKAQAAGFAYFDTANVADLTPAATAGKPILGCFDDNNNDQLDFIVDRTDECREPFLADLTQAALRILLARDTGPGFFLMVEGGAIDWACHGNKPLQAAGEVVELDRAVTAARQLLEAGGVLRDTLIVVTADHETAGLVVSGPYGKGLGPDQPVELKWAQGNHTAMFVPLYASGPGAAALAGRHDNAELGRILKAMVTPAAP
jgi:alkaline phosphatase